MAATAPAFTGNLKKALAGLRRINLDGLRWRVFDAKGQVLGRLASQIAVVLQGKDKPTYAPHVENGDMCIVLNAKDISVTGRKMTDKIYYWHTGYVGHLKERRLKDQMEKDPTEVIRKAVLRMLPRNRLRDIEGARREGGKGDSIWDVFTDDKERVLDRSNAEIAVDHYHRYKEDIELMASLGFSAYRFSISWARIFPDGLGEKVNEQGVAFYNDLINFMISKGIEPYATLYHWDLPNNLQKTLGGWISDKIVEYFALYAEACFANFGDRVKHWITINEPLQTAINGYGIGIFAPGGCQGETARCYLAAHHQILAHAAAVDVYRRKFKVTQGGEVGLVVDCEWAEPFSENVEDQIAAQRRIDFQLGWYLDPIYFGDYPESMRQRLGSDLPTFSEKDKEFIRNKIDFVGLNHYTSRLIAHHQNPDDVYFYQVQQMERIEKWNSGEKIGERAASEWLFIVPWGLRKVLNYIAKKYNNPAIYVTENGMDEEDDQSATLDQVLNDTTRVGYFKGYLNSVAQAIKDGADVRGYFAWSFLDNFEWAMGYTKRFGIVYVDYKNGLSRHPKASALWFSHFLKGEAAENKADKN